ncbi:MAG: hypothetical protein LBM70_01845 [Victivallales bacterium]|jgi:uncharacterized protein HemX|nr:hypothetical protein [Victivallales bacterium]
MNIQSGTLRKQRKITHRSGVSLGTRLTALLKFAALLVVIALCLNMYIYLNQRISETDRSIRQTVKQLEQTNREIAQLRIRREQLSRWEHIRAKIEQFQLGLHEPSPGQVSRMALLSPRQAEMIPLASVASARSVRRANDRHN